MADVASAVEVFRHRGMRCLVRRPRPGAALEEVVLLLAGAAGRAEHWAYQLTAEVWPPSCCVVAADYPGSGDFGSVRAAGGPRLSTEAVATLMWEALHAIGVVAGVRVHLVGLSFGGMVVQKMAAQHPEVVAAVVLINTYPGLRTGSRPFPFFIGGLVWLTLCSLMLCRLDKATSDLNEAWLLWGPPAWCMPRELLNSARCILAKASAQRQPRPYWDAAAEWAYRRFGDVSFVVAILRHSLSATEVARLRTVPRRVVVASGRDWLVNPDNGRRLSVLLDCKLAEFQSNGHLLQLEAPDHISKCLVQWCSCSSGS